MSPICRRGHTFRGSEPCPACWPGYRTFSLKAKVWLYPGKESNWHFVTLSKKRSDILRERFGTLSHGWGSLPVRVKVGQTEWTTSVFPEKKNGVYLLPLKASVRKKEKIEVGKVIVFALEVQV